MFKTPEKRELDEDELDSIALETNRWDDEPAGGHRPTFIEHKTGVVMINHYMPSKVCKVVPDTDTYGVSDTVTQAIKYCANVHEMDTEAYCIFVTKVEKDGCRSGGMRWGSQGPYIGRETITAKHLNHEYDFDDGVFVFSAHRLE